MFSDKNYGIPKDLIEAAKRVHEKQLMEYNEEVQFTEEELAEAFAIFLEENFHVEMLTEEDLDYVFEEEFPQWLDMIVEKSLSSANQRRELDKMGLYKTSKDKIVDITGGKDRIGKLVRGNQLRKKYGSEKKADMINTPRGRNLNTSDVTITSAKRSASGAPLTKQDATADAVKGDTMGGHTSAPKPKSASAPTPTPGKQVSAKPASTARKQVRRPSSTGSSVYKPQSRIMKDTGAAAPDFGNNNATFDAENKPVFKSDTETRRAANLRTISKRKRPAPTRRAPTRRAPTRRAPTRRAPTRSWKTTVFNPDGN